MTFRLCLVVGHRGTCEDGEADFWMHFYEMALAFGRHEPVDLGDLGQDGEGLGRQALIGDPPAKGEGFCVAGGP